MDTFIHMYILKGPTLYILRKLTGEALVPRTDHSLIEQLTNSELNLAHRLLHVLLNGAVPKVWTEMRTHPG